MITNCAKGIYVGCNSCEEKVESKYDFKGTIEFIKQLGWKVKKQDDKWEHYCPECVKRFGV